MADSIHAVGFEGFARYDLRMRGGECALCRAALAKPESRYCLDCAAEGRKLQELAKQQAQRLAALSMRRKAGRLIHDWCAENGVPEKSP